VIVFKPAIGIRQSEIQGDDHRQAALDAATRRLLRLGRSCVSAPKTAHISQEQNRLETTLALQKSLLCHFDRSDAERRKAEKSIQKQISRLACGSLEMTFYTLK